ncbi:MAG: hypothetical protein A3I11_08430 [Elusimicrobia bacterium RIFCSPLOWO2_02_FULL_39_32]|nr:MAG: hypothetical protein A2034_00025 [Elusimicrobia bacterium GWA2_38_7]OGR79294.1 MAG: hypothetical protein A3B80_08695 [Elusimicrobia bacterium RIFCSPHIGHO2_02_FULL_39_36]OGR93195.1 MAG: hypothetical protein A3I11_08430 [Elusimicrobia bacterium RIFCSPLOWO2_02_FULL_39_32]OGR99420.1 MAG: hypothetical protein A3G85_06875 [Elusimicrobia bacterium RIFCSPLOWO2_12_FULL_39_28]
MNILEKIVALKKKSLKVSKEKIPLKKLIVECEKRKKPSSFRNAISLPNELSIIAEMKKQSPSAGLLVKDYSPVQIGKRYEACGARALSILTEENFFLGSPDHLKKVAESVNLPILRKDFIIDPYQIYESLVLGADAILLIISILTTSNYLKLIQLSKELQLDALVEVHTEEELKIALKGDPNLIGINNRDLKNLSCDLKTTFKLKKKIPKGITTVSESGIKSVEDINKLKSAGIQAALIGETLLKKEKKEQILSSLVKAGL